jgi:hypothetical protein
LFGNIHVGKLPPAGVYKCVGVSSRIYDSIMPEDLEQYTIGSTTFEYENDDNNNVVICTSKEFGDWAETYFGYILNEGKSVYIYDGDVTKMNPSIEYTGDLFESPVYNEVDDLKRPSTGAPVLALTNDKGVHVKKNLTLHEFFEYFSGKVDSPDSKHKKLVFDLLSEEGYT